MSKTILLADDSVTIQKVIELTFMDQDYEVVAVSTGDEAVQRLGDMQPDLVIADVHMPGANGYEVARHSKDRFPGVPVLLLVGTFEPFDEGEMASSGADSHLKKPFDSQELLQLVNRLMESAEAAAPTAGEPAESTDEPASSSAPASPGPTPVPDVPAPPAAGAETVRLDSLNLESMPGAGEEGESPEPPALQEAAPESEGPPGGQEAGLAQDDLGQESVTWGNLDLEAVEEEEVPVAEPGSAQVEAPEDATPLSEQPDQSSPFRLSDTDSGEFALEPDSDTEAPAGSEPPAPAAPASPEGAAEVPDVPEVSAEAPAAASSEPSPVPGAASPATGLSDEDVERIARRVAELVGEKAVKEVAWEVIPDLAEVVIKDRIQQLENQVE